MENIARTSKDVYASINLSFRKQKSQPFLKNNCRHLNFPSGTPSIMQKKNSELRSPWREKITETRRISLGDQEFNLSKVEREDSSKSAQREMFIGCLKAPVYRHRKNIQYPKPHQDTKKHNLPAKNCTLIECIIWFPWYWSLAALLSPMILRKVARHFFAIF